MSDQVHDCLRNLRQLVEMEMDFGVDEVPVTKPVGGSRASADQHLAAVDPVDRTAARSHPEPRAPRDVPARPAGKAVRDLRPPVAGPPQPDTRGSGAQRTTTGKPDLETAPRQTLEVWPEPDFGGNALERLKTVAAKIRECIHCPLHRTRINAVPGEGNPKAEIMFIGEGPGADEDAQGRPFVGAAGQLLDKMITAMGLKRDEVFIANVLKCRPPGNRTPTTEEACICGPWLCEQIAAISPTVICTLGAAALKALRGDDRLGIIKHRGKAFTYRDITVIPTFHPSYLLRNDSAKKPTWEDLKLVLKTVGREPPARNR